MRQVQEVKSNDCNSTELDDLSVYRKADITTIIISIIDLVRYNMVQLVHAPIPQISEVYKSLMSC